MKASGKDRSGICRCSCAAERAAAVIKVLRPYLIDGTLDSFTSASSNMPSGVTPMRYSELAAMRIGPSSFFHNHAAGTPSRVLSNTGGRWLVL